MNLFSQAFVFIAYKQAVAGRTDKELAKSEVAGGAQVIICSAQDALQVYMQ